MIALISGIGGMDGSYLAEHLLELGYEVHGGVRRHSVVENQDTRVAHLSNKIKTHYLDVTDSINVMDVFDRVRPDEVYHLAAQSHVQISFSQPLYTQRVNGEGTLNMLEAVKKYPCKMYNASTSEQFGNSADKDGYQRETTPMVPVSPYGSSKLYAFNLCRNYREAYGLKVSSGIMFNHCSPRRGKNFVEAKIISGACEIKRRERKYLELGNLDSFRDWGHAKDYVEMMPKIIKESDDFIIATGKSHQVKDIVEYVFKKLGLNMNKHIRISDKYKRPNELHNLKGDATKATMKLGWSPSYNFQGILNEMIEYYERN